MRSRRRRRRDPTPVFLLVSFLAVAVVFAGVELGDILGEDRMEEPSRTMDAPTPTEEDTPPRERVRVEVLNAAGTPGIAARASRRLRDAGFDVVYYGNARAFDRSASVVVDRVGAPSLAEEIGSTLGIHEIESAPDPELLVEASVLLGTDWDGGAAEALEGEDAAEDEVRPWWTPSRIFRDPVR